MGADIHMMVEYRQYPETDEWEAITRNVHIGRSYRIFAKLAGVRGHGPKPKGLPHNVSVAAFSERQALTSDAHSASWCTREELRNAITGNADCDGIDMYLAFLALMDSFENSGGSARAVFWFDN